MTQGGAGPDSWHGWWGNHSGYTAYLISVSTRWLCSVDMSKGWGETFDRYCTYIYIYVYVCTFLYLSCSLFIYVYVNVFTIYSVIQHFVSIKLLFAILLKYQCFNSYASAPLPMMRGRAVFFKNI